MLSPLQQQLVEILDQVLVLKGRTAQFDSQTKLLGALPELDSLAVASVLTEIEKTFKIRVEDDEIDGAVFATIESLTLFVSKKIKTA